MIIRSGAVFQPDCHVLFITTDALQMVEIVSKVNILNF